MNETDIQTLSPTKLATLARSLGLRQDGRKGLWSVRKSVTDPHTRQEHEFRRSTKTADLRLAVHRASGWVEEFAQQVRGSRLPTLSGGNRMATLDQVKVTYLAAGTCAPATRRKNFQRLESILHDMYSARNGAPVSVDALDGRLARLWQLQRKAAAERAYLPHDYAACEQAKRGANAIYRQARSVFSSAMLRAYEDAGLALPAGVREFGRQGFLQASPPPPAEQLDPAAVAKLWRLMPRLRAVRPGIWAAVLLMFRGGCRNCEAAKARWSWLVPFIDGSFTLQVHTQGDFKPKAKPRIIRLAAGVVELLQAVRREGDDHLVPAATEAERVKACTHGVNKFLTACGVDRVKGKISYRLRGHAITEIILAHGLDAAQEFAGHTSRHTTEIYKGAAVPYVPLALPAATAG